MEYLSFDADFSSSRIVAAYDELPFWSALFGQLLLDEVPLRGVTAALDVGCGTGFPLIELAERLGVQAHVHGLDLWTAGLTRAAEKISCRGTPNVSLHVGNASAMTFADGSFDLIVSNLGVNNFDNPAAAIRECRRVIKPRGTIALTTNLQGHMQEFYALFANVLDEAGDADARGRLRNHVNHRATLSGLRDLLEGNGFSVGRVLAKNAWMRFADGSALFRHHFVKLAFLDDWKKVVPERQAEIFSSLERRLNAAAREQGEIRLTIPMAYIEAGVA